MAKRKVSERETVYLGDPIDEIAADVWRGLEARSVEIYRAGGRLVRLVDAGRGPVMEALTGDSFAYMLGESFFWVDARKKKVPLPPAAIVRALLSTPPASVRELVTVAAAPFLWGAEIVDRPGYHAPSGIYLSGLTSWRPMPQAEIMEVLEDWWGDFPFARDCDRAHAVSLALLPFVRPAIAGPVPLHLIEAPLQGSGKTLLAQCALGPGLGGRKVAAERLGEDEGEVEKRIASILLSSPPAVLLDNQRGRLGSPALEAVLTSDSLSVRLLGGNERRELAARAVWVLTSNNAALSTDLVRRTVSVRLDHGVESAAQIQSWRHPDLWGWTLENGDRLRAALLSMIWIWIQRGRPAPAQSLSSYGGYSAIVGGILSACGVPGFLGDRAELAAGADPEGAEWAAFVRAWATAYGSELANAASLRALAYSSGYLDAVLGDGGERSQQIRLGRALERMRDRVFGGYRITRRTSGSSGFWALVKT